MLEALSTVYAPLPALDSGLLCRHGHPKYHGVRVSLLGILLLGSERVSRVCADATVVYEMRSSCTQLRRSSLTPSPRRYTTRTFFRVYANRIEINQPVLRFPFGILGCGSWNADNIVTHPFDRGAFGFQRMNACTNAYCCCVFPIYGDVIPRRSTFERCRSSTRTSALHTHAMLETKHLWKRV